MSNGQLVQAVTNEQTVMDVYAAFQRGDVAAITALVTDDVDWRNDDVVSRECPWNGNYSGKGNLPGFFRALAESLDFAVFDVRQTASAEKVVAVSLRIESTVRKNGRPLKNDVMHLWNFNESGQITRYRHFNDTAAELLAWRD